MAFLLGFDIGGTFTDFSLLDTASGKLRTYKRLTTPHNPALGVMDGVREILRAADISAQDVATAYHATTLVANTLIERNGARVALLATRGHRDVLDIRTEQRYDVYDLFLQYPAPLVPRHLRFGVTERIDRDGRMLDTPIQTEIDLIADQIHQHNVEAIAIAFLHSYRNAAHEQQVASWLGAALQQRGVSIPISMSSEIAPEIREYERTSTTAANAYVQPKMQSYLERIEQALRNEGYRGRLYLTLSSGGNASAKTAAACPVRLVESGPAAGAIAAAHFGATAGERDLIAFDMGGTTAKICVIQDSTPDLARNLEVARLQRFKKGSGIPLQFPSVDMIEIGAGGGSIAHLDTLGLLKIGPESAASDPGPACYGLGGTAPTVTDANLLLGYLNADNFAGGKMKLHTANAERAMQPLATALNRSMIETAWGVHQLVNENMASAAKIHVIEKGCDPRGYAMLAYGGGGPIHGAQVARILGAKAVICPLGAGVGSAIGLLIAPMSFELAQSYPMRWADADLSQLDALLGELESRGRAQLREAGVTRGIVVERSADGRFVGQLHDLTIALPHGKLTARKRQEIQAQFFARYREQYGHVPNANGAIEFVSWRVTVRGPKPDFALKPIQPNSAPKQARKGTRRAYFGEHGWIDTPVYDRYALRSGARVRGPAIIEERESTAILPPNSRAQVDAHLNLIIQNK